ncbi:Uncharacterized protein Fot_34380 [Forsythia ovata]|uniref:Uncharacterized protein n=1 Tax=Forsythia ovata TaxID=205694 RepID=A0ABD1SIJ3_9LAMI
MKEETIGTNVVSTLTLADGFKEEDTPNFIGSFYSKTKEMVAPPIKNASKISSILSDQKRKINTQLDFPQVKFQFDGDGWVSPLAYAYNAIIVNEKFAPRLMDKLRPKGFVCILSNSSFNGSQVNGNFTPLENYGNQLNENVESSSSFPLGENTSMQARKDERKRGDQKVNALRSKLLETVQLRRSKINERQFFYFSFSV